MTGHLRLPSRLRTLLTGLASALLVTAFLGPAAAGPSNVAVQTVVGGGGEGAFYGKGIHVGHVSLSYAAPTGRRTFRAAASSAPALPALHTFGDSFQYGTQTYRYRMVGSNPTQIGATTTTTPVVVIPIKIVLSDGTYTYPFPATVTNSALFKPAAFSSGTTQYGDAIQRAEFWQYTQGSNYHSLLGIPTVRPQVTLHVPAGSGQIVILPSGVQIMAVEARYFIGQLNAIAANIPANVLPLFISWNNVLYFDLASGKYTPGYHSVTTTASGDHTYAYAAWQEPASFGANWSELVTHSHEVAEWYNDPYGANEVPQWSTRTADCSTQLEVGDPVTGHAFTAVAAGVRRHYQDAVFLSYFTRTIPSIGINGRYTYLGTYTTFSTGGPNC